MTTRIAEDQALVTLINVFTVEPDKQAALVDVLTEATDQVMRFQPGFISANIHRSLDGKRVTNYAQWRSRDDFETMQKNPEAAKHMKACAALAQFDAHLYEVAHVEARGDAYEDLQGVAKAPAYSPPSRL